MKTVHPIDFVVTWVDGNDPEWMAEKSVYSPSQRDNRATINRFRDWNLMKYWFRGIERFAPWVNHIYFVTYGHYPAWLNLDHPQLTLITHKEYIPDKFLPTFNSNVIELFLHRIPGLSEQFVLFNDDMFLTAPVFPKDFFRKGLPVEAALLDAVVAQEPEDIFPHTILNNFSVINKYFSKHEVIKKHWRGFFSPKYKKELIRNILFYPTKYFSGFRDLHLPTSHLKSTFETVWNAEPTVLSNCCTHRFRSYEDVSHWLMKEWQICEGKFIPRDCSWGKYFELGRDIDVCAAIEKQRYRAICLNDSNPNLDVNQLQRELNQSFQSILPDRSSYEKD